MKKRKKSSIGKSSQIKEFHLIKLITFDSHDHIVRPRQWSPPQNPKRPLSEVALYYWARFVRDLAKSHSPNGKGFSFVCAFSEGPRFSRPRSRLPLVEIPFGSDFMDLSKRSKIFPCSRCSRSRCSSISNAVTQSRLVAVLFLRFI